MDGISDEQELIRRIQGGEVNLYEGLVERYKNYVFSVVQNYVPAEVVSEISHNVFVEAYKSILKLQKVESFKSWLATVAVRRCYDYWRVEKRRRKEIPMSSLTETQSSNVDMAMAGDADNAFDDRARGEHAKALLYRVLNKLSAEERMLIVMLYIEDRPTKETADMLGWTVTNTKVKAFRARRKLEQMLKKIDRKGESL